MDFVGNLLLFGAVKEFSKSSRIDKVIAMIRVAPFFDSRCRMWANVQRDGRPAEHRWRPLFNTAKFG